MADLYARDLVGYSKTPIIKPSIASIGGRSFRFSAVMRLAAATTSNGDGNDTVNVANGDQVLLAKVPAGYIFDFGVMTASATMGASATLAIGVKTGSGTGAGSSGAFSFTLTSPSGTIFPGQEVSGTGIGTGAQVVSYTGGVVTVNVANSGAVSGTINFGSTARYRAAATFTTADTPTFFGTATSQAMRELPVQTDIWLTVAAANLPSAGTLVIDLYFNKA